MTTAQLKAKIESDLQALCDMQAGSVWTEYHWRMALQLQLDFAKLCKEATYD